MTIVTDYSIQHHDVMVRTQIQLTKEQHSALKRIALEEGLSMAEVVRMAVDYFQSSRKRQLSAEVRERAKSIIGKYESKSTDGSIRHDEYIAGSIQ